MSFDKTVYVIVGLVIAIGLLFAVMVSGPVGFEKIGRVGAVKRLAAAELRDPSSAQFRSLKNDGLFVCGEINGKNGYGAYSGFARFYGDKDGVTIDNGDTSRLTSDFPSDSERFDRSWKAYCN